ncbi:type II toxin-antitoxin system RelE/ParE family toxin [Enorma massiliensis]|uniref:type II toxin-antitoxin system RelE/ParE family toxin n=1 Tax=Enorma massiliensis TaxID=1472761 RepID=UPI003A926080
MAYKLEILESARRDEEDIVRYLARDAGSPAAALKFMDELDERARRIQQFPFSRQLCPDSRLAEAGYRSFVIMSYVVLYLVKEDTVYIARIFHQRQDYAGYVYMDDRY